MVTKNEKMFAYHLAKSGVQKSVTLWDGRVGDVQLDLARVRNIYHRSLEMVSGYTVFKLEGRWVTADELGSRSGDKLPKREIPTEQIPVGVDGVPTRVSDAVRTLGDRAYSFSKLHGDFREKEEEYRDILRILHDEGLVDLV